MPRHSRVGDIGIGICPCHQSPVQYTTVFVTGAETVKTNELTTTIISTIGMASCGHPTVALTGSPSVLMENKPVHRIGDTGTNCGPYTSITGSSDSISN